MTDDPPPDLHDRALALINERSAYLFAVPDDQLANISPITLAATLTNDQIVRLPPRLREDVLNERGLMFGGASDPVLRASGNKKNDADEMTASGRMRRDGARDGGAAKPGGGRTGGRKSGQVILANGRAG